MQSGDALMADDPAMNRLGLSRNLGHTRGRPLWRWIGQQKGRDTTTARALNFGQAKPEGFLQSAARQCTWPRKFGRPVFTFVDTPGAYPGIDGRERGQAEDQSHAI